MSQHDTLTLRDALRSIQYDAATLADAQVIALQALNATYPARAALSATQPARAAQSTNGERYEDQEAAKSNPSRDAQVDQLRIRDADGRVGETESALTAQAALLSDDEIDAMANEAFEGYMRDRNDDFDRAFAHAVESAILAKLQATQEPVQAGELPDERAAFEQWWRQRQLLTFPNYYAQSRLADWGYAYKPAAKDAWQARAALSARKPFTNAQIERLFYNSNRGNGCASLAAFVRVVRLVESAHGIGLEVKP
jgi:hypothetical protein